MGVAGRDRGWLVSPCWDLTVFAGPALLSLLLLAIGRATGDLWGDTPAWTWILAVVLVDVAHVWATLYRVYLDPVERARRRGLYFGIPLAAYVFGVLLYSHSASWFWRALAYSAVIHFVRQQWGWVKLYRRKLAVDNAIDRWLDDAVIYVATLYPMLYWHASLPREFHWLIAGDFLPGLPKSAATTLAPLHLAIGVAWVLREGALALRGRPVSPGKIVLVVTTWTTWYLGIVVFDSDYAFTVTNVFVHGVPYLALVWRWGRERHRDTVHGVGQLFAPGLWPLFLLSLAAFAWSEEWLWDLLVWHEQRALFPGPDLALGETLLALLVPLLAVPQATHYALDAVLWRVAGGDPAFTRAVGLELRAAAK